MCEARLLGQMGYSLCVNHKKRANASSPQRDAQFARIAELREHFAAETRPIISVDTKKKELVGLFKNPGVAWNREPVEVNDHDFRSYAGGIAIPYGIYDLTANQGTLYVGTIRDTPWFVVDAIETWWRTDTQRFCQPGFIEGLRDRWLLDESTAEEGSGICNIWVS